MDENIIEQALPKVEDQEIIRENEHLKAPPKYLEITWKTYRIAGFVLFILSLRGIFNLLKI